MWIIDQLPYFIIDIAGSAFVPVGSGVKAAKGLAGMAKAKAAVKTSAAIGAAMGAAEGLGRSDGDLRSVEGLQKVAVDVAVGGALGHSSVAF